MIYLILGLNAYKAEQEVAELAKKTGLTPERFDGASMNDNQLADIMRGGNLFAEKRFVVIGQLSDNKALWIKLADWAPAMTTDTTLALLEIKPDKRTKAYKSLTKLAKLTPVEQWTEYDSGIAENWLQKYAKQKGVMLSRQLAQSMVARALVQSDYSTRRVVDQFQLVHAVAALSSLEVVTEAAVTTVLPPVALDTVFDLLEAAAHRDSPKTKQLLDDLVSREDPHKAFALIIAQWAQLVSIAMMDGSSSTVATELGIHPYVAKNLQALARRFTLKELKEFTRLAAELDATSKRYQFDPWDGLTHFLYAVTLRP